MQNLRQIFNLNEIRKKRQIIIIQKFSSMQWIGKLFNQNIVSKTFAISLFRTSNFAEYTYFDHIHAYYFYLTWSFLLIVLKTSIKQKNDIQINMIDVKRECNIQKNNIHKTLYRVFLSRENFSPLFEWNKTKNRFQINVFRFVRDSESFDCKTVRWFRNRSRENAFSKKNPQHTRKFDSKNFDRKHPSL